MKFEPAPFDVVEASRRVWLDRWSAASASGMEVYTGILRSFQLLDQQVTTVMRRHGLTFGRYEVLAWLAAQPEPNLTLSWISRTLRMPPATLTNVIDHLEEKGLIRRVAHPSDARTTVARITPKGRQLSERVTEQLNREVYELIPLSEGARRALAELLRQLRADGNEFDATRSDELIDGMNLSQSGRDRSR